jgi:hypothetical protein
VYGLVCIRYTNYILCIAQADIIGKPLKTEFHLNNIYKFSSYLTGNTLRLHYKAQPVNAVRETIAVYCENHTEHTYIYI